MSFVQTYLGNRVDLLTPNPDDIDIRDIAHSLSRQARFNGHTHSSYYVAQHCILAASLSPSELQLKALLHDATEFVLADLPHPLKTLIPRYKEIENNMQIVIYWKYGIDSGGSKELDRIDRSLALTEGKQLMNGRIDDWDEDGKFEELDIEVLPWSSNVCYALYLHYFNNLRKGNYMPYVRDLNMIASDPALIEWLQEEVFPETVLEF